MADGAVQIDPEARDRAWSMPLEEIDVADPRLFETDSHWPYFERLRREDPVHYAVSPDHGPYWSITKYKDIMDIDTNHQVFSYASGITIGDAPADFRLQMFIAMDPPKHDAQRKVVSPIVSPAGLARMEDLIRSRAAKILGELPIGETFDWVDKVSIELTTQMLATLFDFPFEERRKLTYWSDMATAPPGTPKCPTIEFKREVLMECLNYFMGLWNQRVNAEPGEDLIS